MAAVAVIEAEAVETQGSAGSSVSWKFSIKRPAASATNGALCFLFYLGIVLCFFSTVSFAKNLKIITYNVAGAPVFMPLAPRALRFPKITQRLRRSDYDIVALQEVWTKKDTRFFINNSEYPYNYYFKNNILFGNGLVVMSRYPAVKIRFFPFTVNDPFQGLFDPEIWADKGILALRFDLGHGRSIDFYDIHIISEIGGLYHTLLRYTQIYELAWIIREFSRGHPFILAGDFNIPVGSPDYKILINLAKVRDTCLSGPAKPCATTSNDGLRIDHIFISRHFPESSVIDRGNDFAVWGRAQGAIRTSDHQAYWVKLGIPERYLGAREPLVDLDRDSRIILYEIRESMRRYLKEISRRAVARQWIPLYNVYYSYFVSRRVIALINLDREIYDLAQRAGGNKGKLRSSRAGKTD